MSNREHESMLERARQDALAERDALAQERETVAREMGHLAAEWRRVQAEREATQLQRAEAVELKARAIKRARTLTALLAEVAAWRESVSEIPAKRRSPALRQAAAAATRVQTAQQQAMEDDTWLAVAMARAGRSGAGR